MSPAIEKYLDLTRQIKALADERDLLKARLVMGRNIGSTADIVMRHKSSSSISVFSLRQYLTDTIIDRCRSTRTSLCVAVVPHLKPPKPPKAPK